MPPSALPSSRAPSAVLLWITLLSVGLLSGILLPGPGRAEDLSMARLASCGTDLVAPDDCEDCSGAAVFAVDGYWHGLEQCTRDLRDAWLRSGPQQRLDLPGRPSLADFTRDQMLAEMSRDRVRFRRASDGRLLGFAESFGSDLQPVAPLSGVMLVNKKGQPYNGMGQTGLAHFLYQFAALADRGGYEQAARDSAFYRALARGAVQTVLTPVASGGLASSQPCALAADLTCTWYHSITRRDTPPLEAGTINQMLHVLRDFGLIDKLILRQGWAEPFDLQPAIAAGLNQLFLSGGSAGPYSPPDLADFNSQGRNSQGPAWAFYGFDIGPGLSGKGYFLKNTLKNCGYHLHDLDLMDAILARATDTGIAPQARAAAGQPASVLHAFTEVLSEALPPGTARPEITCNSTMQRRITKRLSGAN